MNPALVMQELIGPEPKPVVDPVLPGLAVAELVEP
jgi:hypothetical protein